MIWSCRLSISGHTLAGVLQTVSEILPHTPRVSSRSAWRTSTSTHNTPLLGKQAPSVTGTLLQMTHTIFIVDSAAKKEKQVGPPS